MSAARVVALGPQPHPAPPRCYSQTHAPFPFFFFFPSHPGRGLETSVSEPPAARTVLIFICTVSRYVCLRWSYEDCKTGDINGYWSVGGCGWSESDLGGLPALPLPPSLATLPSPATLKYQVAALWIANRSSQGASVINLAKAQPLRPLQVVAEVDER